MQEFEFCKRDFGLVQDPLAEHQITLAMEGADESQNYDADEGKVTFSSEDLESWFRPVVEKILAMLGEQMRQSQLHSGQPINVSGSGNSPIAKLTKSRKSCW